METIRRIPGQIVCGKPLREHALPMTAHVTRIAFLYFGLKAKPYHMAVGMAVGVAYYGLWGAAMSKHDAQHLSCGDVLKYLSGSAQPEWLMLAVGGLMFVDHKGFHHTYWIPAAGYVLGCWGAGAVNTWQRNKSS